MKPLHNNLSRTSSLLLGAVALGTAITSLTAAPLIYEPFSQDAGALGGKAGGTGLSGNWTTNQTTTVVNPSTINHGDLANTDGQLELASSGNNTFAWITTTSALADNDLLDNGATLWFSMVYQKTAQGGSNEWSGFVFGSDKATGANGVIMDGTGNGLGFITRNDIRAGTWVGGGNVFGGYGGSALSLTLSEPTLIVGRIDWAPTTSDNHTITIYSVALDDLSTLGTGVSKTIAGTIDQTAFNTITIKSRNSGAGSIQTYDEIRFGASIADVIPNTADEDDPLLASTLPVNDGITDGVLQAVFNEFVAIGTGNIRIYDVNDTVTPHTTIAVTDASQVSTDGVSTLTIIPTTRLSSGETYYVEMDAGVVKDQGGNDFAGFTGDTIWKFTADDTAPTVVSLTSEIGSADIFVGLSSETYTLTFDKPMDPTTITVADFDNDGTADVDIASVTQISLTTFLVDVVPVSAGTLTLRLLSANSVADLTGNELTAPFSGPSKEVLADPYSPTFTGATNNTYTTTSNWDAGFLPLKDWSATIVANKTAVANSAEIPTYSGGLTLETASQLTIGNTVGSVNAMGTGPITAEGASTIQITIAETPLDFPALVLDSNLTVTASSNTEDNKTRNFPGDITGDGLFTYNMRRGTIITLTGNNSTWSGGFVANNIDFLTNNQSRIRPDNGGFGTGDVTLNNGISLEILSGRGDVIDDGAALYLNGTGRTDIRKLALNSNETVNEFWLDGVQLPPGDYTSASGLVDDIGNPLITGSGTLTVLSGPGAPPTLVSIVNDVDDGPVLINTPVTYTLTFSKDMDASSIDSTDFGNAGTSSVSIGSIDETSSTVFTVVVTPTSAGTLQFQINQDAEIEDVDEIALDTSSAITDITIITVNNPPPTDPFEAWAGVGVLFNDDASGDGISNGLAWLLGAANPNDNALDLLPTVTEDAGGLVLTFRCLKVAGRGGATLNVQHSSDLGINDAWESAEVPDDDDTINAVNFVVTDDGDFVNIVATIPVSEADDGKLFGRLSAEPAP